MSTRSMAQKENPRLDFALQALNERRWLRHGLFWLAHTVLMTWLLVDGCHKAADAGVALRYSLQALGLYMLAAYSLLYGVLPALPPESSGRHFGWLLVGWLLLSMLLTFAFRYLILLQTKLLGISYLTDDARILSSGAYLLVLGWSGVAACLYLYRQWQQKQLVNARLTQENYRARLQLLKAQIQPHFLFNTLNNLYALTLKQSDRAPEVVDRLTGLLQFVVEQGNAPLVSLRDEADLLKNFLALERLRYGERLTLQFQAENMPTTGRIAPLLLLPLVENAFKHGAAEQLGETFINISLTVQDGWFTCVIINSKNANPAQKVSSSGIGLANVRQRLQLLYPQRHHFQMEAQDETFTVRLSLLLPEAPASLARPSKQPAARAARREAAPQFEKPEKLLIPLMP
jgi:hypothetical protein